MFSFAAEKNRRGEERKGKQGEGRGREEGESEGSSGDVKEKEEVGK